MVEVQRIIQEGIIPTDFLAPETICDFYVDEKRKKIWAIGIDLLVKFDDVCRRHNLKYIVAFGSLLGIIRHRGFIPWDDDIDVVMPREDYEKLKKYKSEFEEPYFLQFPGEDNDYFFSFAKLRNSMTTGVSIPFRYCSFNQGQFLDIFPLDNYSSKNLEENYLRIKTLISECSSLMRQSNPHIEATAMKTDTQSNFCRNGLSVIKELESVLCQYQNTPSDKYVAWCCVIYDHKRMTFKKKLFNELIEVDFYGHHVFIPKQYDEVLKITYNDYMTLPPLEKRGSWHSNSIFNPDVSYKDVLQQLRKQED